MSELLNLGLPLQNQKSCYTTCITCYKVMIQFFIIQTKACFSEMLKCHLKLGNNPFPSPLKIAKKNFSSVLQLEEIKEKGLQNFFCETRSISTRFSQIFFLPQQPSNTAKVEMKTIKATSCEDCRTEERKISLHPTLIQFPLQSIFSSAFKTDTEHGPKSDGAFLPGCGESFRNIPLI